MSLQRLSYNSIGDAQHPRSEAELEAELQAQHIKPRWKVGAATTVILLGVVVAAVCHSQRDEERQIQWQQYQPLDAKALTAFSEQLTYPEERSSDDDGELRTTLRVAPTVACAGPLAPSLNVRAYEGSVPGPTLRVKPGDRLVINLANQLHMPEGLPRVSGGDAGSWSGAGGREALEGSVEAWPNVTNLHVHGMHVSPSGVADNIYRRAGPGDVLEYEYLIPADHYPGTFYYHPHFEGSSSVQTLGGMSGVIVVEDPPGTLPVELEAMRDVVMVIQETNVESGSLRNYKSASKIAGSKMPLYGERPEESGEGGTEGDERSTLLHFVTINGQYQPVLAARPGEATRVRLVHAGNNDHMYISVQSSWRENSGEKREAYPQADDRSQSSTAGADVKHGDGGEDEAAGSCTLLTLARDGVYLPTPRLQGGGRGHLVLAPGSRADVALLCDRPGVYRLFSSKGGRAAEEGEGEPVMDFLGNKTDVFEGTLAFVDVRGDVMEMELPAESPGAIGESRLLRDLRDVPDSEVSRFVFEFNQGEKVSRLGQMYTWYGVNGEEYDVESISRRVPLGGVEEWVIVNSRLGRGEGAVGCQAPLKNNATSSGEGGSGGGNRRRSLRWLLSSRELEGEGGGEKMREHDEKMREQSEADKIKACERAGPGKKTLTGHPFHLHVNHFQVVGSSWGQKDGPDWSVGDWRDTVSVPTPGNVTVRWRADDFTGEAVAHCHIFGHSDTGMMMNFEIFAEP